MSALNPAGWQPSMGDAQNPVADLVTSSGDRGLMLEEPLSFEIGAVDKCGVDMDEPGLAPVASLGAFLRKSAPDLPAKNFTAMLRLDHNRAASQIAAKIGCAVGDIEKLAVWGNHSPTMYADYRFATVNGKSVKETINDHDWNANTFLPTVGKRGAAIIAARGLSSAASAANAAIDHMHDWALGTNGKWVTMGIPSKGEYGIPAEVMFGYPVTCEGGEYKIVEGLPIDAFSQECINKTLKELVDEQAGVAHLL